MALWFIICLSMLTGHLLDYWLNKKPDGTDLKDIDNSKQQCTIW